MTVARLSQKTVRTLAARLAADGANPFCRTTEPQLHAVWASASRPRPQALRAGAAAYGAAPAQPRPSLDLRV